MLKRIKMVIEQGENEFELVDAYLTSLERSLPLLNFAKLDESGR
ncbi:hypothetical protein [Paenibacillus sp. MZ04-78.2]|nr:hypothetical protein [Paenibacillus sp. MZ04-78.2]